MIQQKLIPIRVAAFQTLTTPRRCMFVDVVKVGFRLYAVAILDTDDTEEKKIELVMYEAGQTVDYPVESLFYITSFIKGVFRKKAIAVYNKRRFEDEKRPYRPCLLYTSPSPRDRS